MCRPYLFKGQGEVRPDDLHVKELVEVVEHPVLHFVVLSDQQPQQEQRLAEHCLHASVLMLGHSQQC